MLLLRSLNPVLPENWVCLLRGVEPKDTSKAKIRRRRDLLLAAGVENTGNLSQSSVSLNSKIEGISNQGYMCIHEKVNIIFP